MKVVLIWTVNSLPAYGRASRWSTARVMGCPKNGIKSHDCHVFMLKFIPIIFREMLPEHVWSALTEGGPLQYRWMYPFERLLRELKKNVKKKAHVEASIVEEIGLFSSQYFEQGVQSKRSMPRRYCERTSSDDGIHVSIFNSIPWQS
ncbi:hypothetical protein Sango_1166700 [Sesamum angolense]|uniref:DUF4218 domain-containing protein n=1 Tax=Sesamum angolense TaxID=2727404 RepID=A0AAE1WWB1_9LAMI|nr:hypothetical protein Sango_1166700 [Sesamum angolense]